MREDYTDLTIVLDRSGSMSSIKADMEGGLNDFLDGQKGLPGELRVSMYQFDTEYERVYAGIDIKDVPKAVLSPRGGTALYDALGRAIDETGDRLRRMAEKDRPGKVLFMVITDGQENSSKERTSEQVKKLVSQQEQEWHWTFVYLGANVDAFAAGADIGVSMARAAGYSPTSGGIKGMMHVNCSKVAEYRASSSGVSGQSVMGYSPDERQAMQGVKHKVAKKPTQK